ncbi:MAG TPA: STAS domain-containing protein [Thermoleophilaceae bacterium]|jgi:anti-anti-sigma factor|nr:STAS domain-containing protein [Thermoleophilaceae bacterium]
MATREAAARVHERDGNAVIELSGEVDRYAEQAVEGAYAEAAALGQGPVLLDFEQVDYINSTGIALIVGLLARARAEGRSVKACGLTDHYREIFEITRLSDFMQIFPDEATALAGSTDEGGTNG